MTDPATYCPLVSLTSSTELTKMLLQVAPFGDVTVHTLPAGDGEVSKVIPAPDNVMRIPALGPETTAVVGMNVNEAVVTIAFALEESVIARPVNRPACDAVTQIKRMVCKTKNDACRMIQKKDP